MVHHVRHLTIVAVTPRRFMSFATSPVSQWTVVESAEWVDCPQGLGVRVLLKRLRKWLGNLGTVTPYIESGNPWVSPQNNFIESYNRCV